jgi:hypothetical protein
MVLYRDQLDIVNPRVGAFAVVSAPRRFGL